jgi:hypothetical protein
MLDLLTHWNLRRRGETEGPEGFPRLPTGDRC